MHKTIIAVYGRKSEGKSSTIKNICKHILQYYPNAVPSIPIIDYSGDILLTIQLGTIKIGFESQGDPGSRMLWNHTVENLAKVYNCDIIICATRTEGDTVKKVDYVADTYGYHTIWLSSFWSPTLNHIVLNQFATESVVEMINALIVGRL